MRGPIDLVDPARSIKPGDEALIRVYPLQPERWTGALVGTEIALLWRPGRSPRGIGLVEQRVNVPESAAPLHRDRLRLRPGAAILWRKQPPPTA